MVKNSHLMILGKLLRPSVAAGLCCVFFCSCGGGNEGADVPDTAVKILWNQSEEDYLLPEEVQNAPSGELRVSSTGEYLDRELWQEKEVLISELEELCHYEI